MQQPPDRRATLKLGGLAFAASSLPWWAACSRSSDEPQPQLLLHAVELLLLMEHAAIQRFDQVFGKAQFGFEFVESVFHGR